MKTFLIRLKEMDQQSYAEYSIKSLKLIFRATYHLGLAENYPKLISGTIDQLHKITKEVDEHKKMVNMDVLAIEEELHSHAIYHYYSLKQSEGMKVHFALKQNVIAKLEEKWGFFDIVIGSIYSYVWRSELSKNAKSRQYHQEMEKTDHIAKQVADYEDMATLLYDLGEYEDAMTFLDICIKKHEAIAKKSKQYANDVATIDSTIYRYSLAIRLCKLLNRPINKYQSKLDDIVIQRDQSYSYTPELLEASISALIKARMNCYYDLL